MRGALLATVSAMALIMMADVSAQQRNADIQRILLEGTLWGRDLPALLAQLPALRAAGETTAYVFSDRAAGATAFPAATAAQAMLQRAREAGAKPVVLQAPLAAMQPQAAQPTGGPLRLEAAKIIDGDGYHLVAVRAAGAVELLPPGLTIAAVRARLGEPEQVSRRTIHAQGESKPVILTLHSYAGGAIAFAESNMTDPGVVERAVLNLAAIIPAVLR